MDWNALIDFVGPLSGALAQGHSAGRTGFLRGWSDAQQQHEQDQRQQQLHTEQQQRMGADYLLKIADHLQGIDDPIQYAQFRGAAETAGVKAGYVKPGDLSHFTFPESKTAAKRLKELTDKLGALEAGGYSLDDLAAGGAHLDLGDGTHVPIATAIDLTQRRPMNATGQAIAKPKKIDTAASTEEERFVAQRAKEYGYGSVDNVDSATALQWRSEFRGAGRAEPKPTVPGAGPNDQLATLVQLYKDGHDQKEPPANVMLQLRVQANKVNDKPSAFGGVAGTGALTDDGVEYSATQYRVTGIMPALGMGNAEARAAIINRAAKQAKDLGQTPAAAIQKQSAFKADGAALTKMRTMSSAAESFESKALAQADIIDQLSANVPRTQWPAINQAIQSGQINLLGNNNTQQLANAVQTFAAEYAKIIEGSTGSAAGSSDSSRRAADRLINPAMNKGTMRDVLNLMRREMKLTVDGYGATIDHITTRMGGGPLTETPTAPATAPVKVGGFTVVVKP